MTQLNLVLLGPPGAGKGTQARRLAAAWEIPHVSTGDILREAVQAGTELGRAAKAVMDAGRLVDDTIMIGIVRERLERPDAASGFLLDGFPRTVPQAEALDAMLGDRDPLIVVDLAVADTELIRRLSRRRTCGECGPIVGAADGEPPATCGECGRALEQRSDDREDVVRERLAVYRENTAPLIEYYRSRPTFRAVDGGLAEEAVAAEAAEVVSGLVERRASA